MHKWMFILQALWLCENSAWSPYPVLALSVLRRWQDYPPSSKRRRVVWQKYEHLYTSVSMERTASIFSVEKLTKESINKEQAECNSCQFTSRRIPEDGPITTHGGTLNHYIGYLIGHTGIFSLTLPVPYVTYPQSCFFLLSSCLWN